jgi:hypothetical protein
MRRLAWVKETSATSGRPAVVEVAEVAPEDAALIVVALQEKRLHGLPRIRRDLLLVELEQVWGEG